MLQAAWRALDHAITDRWLGIRWDALPAATVEHVCDLHELDAPAWIQEQERFLNVPHIFTTLKAHAARGNCLRAGRLHPARGVAEPARPRRARRRTACLDPWIAAAS